MKKKIISLHKKNSPLYRSPNFTIYDILYPLIIGTLFNAIITLAGGAIYYIIKFINSFASLELLLGIVVSLVLGLLTGILIDRLIDEL